MTHLISFIGKSKDCSKQKTNVRKLRILRKFRRISIRIHPEENADALSSHQLRELPPHSAEDLETIPQASRNKKINPHCSHILSGAFIPKRESPLFTVT